MKKYLLGISLLMLLDFGAAIAAPKMQHGFILPLGLQGVSSHLVAQGHHSWQSTIYGKLT